MRCYIHFTSIMSNFHFDRVQLCVNLNLATDQSPSPTPHRPWMRWWWRRERTSCLVHTLRKFCDLSYIHLSNNYSEICPWNAHPSLEGPAYPFTHWIFQETKGAKVVRKAAKVVRKVERTREGKTPLRAKAATKAKQSTSAIFLSGRGGMLGGMVGRDGWWQC